MKRLTLLSLLALAAAPAQDPGRKLFEAQCALCHGQNGGGGRGPSLLKPKLAQAPDEAALRRVISQGLPPEMPGAWQLSENETKQLATYVLSLGRMPPEIVPGDASRGAEVFQRQGCPNCHIVNGAGAGLAPELSAIGTRRNAAHLRESITQPAATLPEGYRMYEVTPTTGAPVTGVRLGEDPFTLQLQDAAGRLHSFRKASVKAIRPLPKRSPMPAYTQLPDKDLDDLVAHLASLKGKP